MNVRDMETAGEPVGPVKVRSHAELRTDDGEFLTFESFKESVVEGSEFHVCIIPFEGCGDHPGVRASFISTAEMIALRDWLIRVTS